MHWRPFYKRCGYCSTPFDVIGKMETFNEDIKYIMDTAGASKVIWGDDIEMLQKNSSPKNSSTTLNYFSQLPKDLKKKLYELFEIDFELFGYSADEYLK